MKPLILILLAATYAAAQTPTIADIARQERARRGASTSTKVYTTADIKTPEPKVEGDAAVAPAPEGAPATPAAAPAGAPAATSTPAPAAATPAVDPVQQWLAETDKLRNQIREIIDKEAVAQLDINAIQNRVNAPVTTVAEKDRALTELGVAQGRLTGIREELSKKRAELQARELAGPPKK
jgi:hypothetical protein